MSTTFDDVVDERGIDPQTANYAKRSEGLAKRKAMLSECKGPMHVLDSLGVDIPGRSFIDDPSEAVAFPSTKHCEAPTGDKITINLFQDVRESASDTFGDFGNAQEDVEDVVWTVSDLSGDTVNLMVVGSWGKRREVPDEEFAEQYDPIYLESGVPKLGY